MNKEMYNEIRGRKCTLSTILKIFNKQVYDERGRINGDDYDMGSKDRFLNLVGYFAGKNGLNGMRDKINDKLFGGAPYEFDFDKFTGKNKVNAKKYLEVFVKIFNDYFEVFEEEEDRSYHGSPYYVKTGYYFIDGKLPYKVSEKINEIFDKNFEEDEKVILKEVKEFRKQQKLAKELEAKEKMASKKQVEKEKKDNENYELLKGIEF